MMNDYNLNYSIEDLVNRKFVGNKKTLNLKDVDYLNKMGVFSVLKNKNTDLSSYALESVRNMSESEAFLAFASQQMNEIKNNLRICSSIKKAYALEGYDIYKFGLEGVGEKIKSVGIAIINALKKIATAFMNKIRQLKLFFKTNFLKKIYPFYDKIKNMKVDPNKGKEIKIAFPKYFIKGTEYIVHRYTGIFDKLNKIIEEVEMYGKDKEKNDKYLSAAVVDSTFVNLLDKEGFKNPKMFVYKTLVFNKKKITPLKTGEFLNMKGCNIELLDKNNIDKDINNFTNCLKSLKTINNLIKNVNDTINKNIDFEKEKGMANFLKEDMGKYHIIGNYCIKGVSVIMILMNVYIDHIVRIYKVAKMHFKENKNEQVETNTDVENKDENNDNINDQSK